MCNRTSPVYDDSNWVDRTDDSDQRKSNAAIQWDLCTFTILPPAATHWLRDQHRNSEYCWAKFDSHDFVQPHSQHTTFTPLELQKMQQKSLYEVRTVQIQKEETGYQQKKANQHETQKQVRTCVNGIGS
jgi:hypothetical protein